jgi:Mor family transcriptional regulator
MSQGTLAHQVNPDPPLHQEWAEIARDTIVDLTAIDGEDALRIAREIVLRIAEEYGGVPIYFTKGVQHRLASQLDARDRIVLTEYNGRNLSELAHRHRVSARHIRRLLKRANALAQGDMFPSGKAPTRR